MSSFFSDFSDFMEQFLLLPGRLLITGDFNIHFENNSDSDAMKYADILDSLGLIQHVTCPTHISGHTLDLIITRNEDNIIVSPPVCDTFLSDHSTLLCHVAFEKAPPVRNTIQLRRLKHIDLEIFRKDISIQHNNIGIPLILNLLLILLIPVSGALSTYMHL